MPNWKQVLKEYVDALETALGNLTGDMSAVSQDEAASLAAYLIYSREMSRAHNQGRICLVVPDLSNLASDLQNTAIKAELDKIGTVAVLDQTGVDGGEEDWDFYDLIVVGSNTYGAFVNANIDDLILLKVPVLVCNRDVAIHLKMGSTQTQSTSDVNEYCETINNRVMYMVFGSLGEKVLFSEATQSDRLDMSDPSLTEQILMVDTTADGNTKAVIGWLPMEDGVGGTNTLDDDTDLPACRIFAGRNIMQASISASIALKASAAQVAAILNDTADMQPRVVQVETDTDPRAAGRLQVFEKTWDGRFGDGAGSDTLFTVSTQDIIVEAIIVKMSSVDLTDDAWDGISVEDNYATTPHVFIDATAGAKANLGINAQLAWTGAVLVEAGSAILATAIGDDADEDALITVYTKFRAVADGGFVT